METTSASALEQKAASKAAFLREPGSGRLMSWLAGCVEAIARQYRLHRAMRDLESLDDRLLRDIGLSRDDIAAAVHGVRRHHAG